MFSLNVKAWLGNFLLALVMGGLLFATAGTVRYWQGWLFLAVFFGAAIVITAHLARHDPALLQRRLAGGPMAEPEAEQKIIMVFASAGFLGLLLVPALVHRFVWSMVPCRSSLSAIFCSRPALRLFCAYSGRTPLRQRALRSHGNSES